MMIVKKMDICYMSGAEKIEKFIKTNEQAGNNFWTARYLS